MTASDIYPYVSVCQPIEDALRQQIEQERLLYEVTTQIHQSLELPVILETVVSQIRQCLQADRLVIYQFDHTFHPTDRDRPPPPHSETAEDSVLPSERVTYESRASEAIKSALNWIESASCFAQIPACREKYQQGLTIAVADITATYAQAPCLLEQLQQLDVKSLLATPILIQQDLWGLLIAHQCREPRQWKEREQNFFQHIAEHLAIAIYQSHLYAQVQQQNQTLEQQVLERTQALQDTLLTAQSANRAKTEFLANISHELRTPLTSVIGMSATLLRWSFGDLSSKQRHYLQTIHDSGKHLLELINDMLDLSQLEAGKLLLKVRDFYLTQVACQSLQILKDSAELRKIALNLEIQQQVVDQAQSSVPSDLPFRADKRRVRQILLNLLSNAIKFTPEGGQVTLRVWLEGERAALQVEDTGIGIAEEHKPLLFEKFQQLDTSYRREYSGTGLGLALTKQLVELHGGWIDVESTLGAGSVFTVWLPNQPAPDLPVPEKSPHTGRIVLLESNESMAKDLCDLLTGAGHQVIWIVEGSSAIGQIRIFQPQLVIVNTQLTGMDGSDLIGQLRHLRSVPDFKVLALTPAANPEAVLPPLLNQRVDAGLRLPVDPQTLLHQVNLLMGTQTALQSE